MDSSRDSIESAVRDLVQHCKNLLSTSLETNRRDLHLKKNGSAEGLANVLSSIPTIKRERKET